MATTGPPHPPAGSAGGLTPAQQRVMQLRRTLTLAECARVLGLPRRVVRGIEASVREHLEEEAWTPRRRGWLW